MPAQERGTLSPAGLVGAWGLRPHYDINTLERSDPRRADTSSSSGHGRGSSGAAAAHHEKILPKSNLVQPPIFSRGCTKFVLTLAKIFQKRSIGGEWRSLRLGCGRCGRFQSRQRSGRRLLQRAPIRPLMNDVRSPPPRELPKFRAFRSVVRLLLQGV